MAAIDYLKLHYLNAGIEKGNRLAVWPKENITPKMRDWIKAHRDELLEEMAVANDPATAALEADIDLLLENLRFDFTGAPLHDIDDELAAAIRLAMLPMGKRGRANLAALIDDELALRGRDHAMRTAQAHCADTDGEVLNDADS